MMTAADVEAASAVPEVLFCGGVAATAPLEETVIAKYPVRTKASRWRGNFMAGGLKSQPGQDSLYGREEQAVSCRLEAKANLAAN
jgi:hypothetical protein